VILYTARLSWAALATFDSRPVNGASDAASQTERAVLALREMLLRGDFPAGQRLTELALAARLGASRTPVRHALNRLAHEGIVEALPAGGFSVRQFTLADIWDAIEIRGALEGIAARLAAQRYRDPGELSRLRVNCAEMEGLGVANVSEFVRFLEVNQAFHAEVWRLARSPMLLRSIEAITALPFAAPGALVYGEAEQAVEQRIRPIALEHHRSIVEAIEERDGARAESVAREHSRVARDNLMRARPDQERLSRVPGGALIKAL
jgi:GntR family transcriptional regulator of vanillate catabolism